MKKEVGLGIFSILIVLLLAFIVFGEDLTGEAISGEAITGEASNQPTNVSVFITAAINNPPVLGPINSSFFVCETEVFMQKFNITDIDEDPLTIGINPEDPFYISYPQSFSGGGATVNSSIISGVLSKTDAGGINTGSKNYNMTIFTKDDYNNTCCYDKANTSITVIEINNVPTIGNIGVQTIWSQGDNSTFYKTVTHQDEEYTTWGYGGISFNISITNSTDGSPINLFNITNAGIINFTANNSQVGVYDITICLNDTALTNTHQNISTLCGQTGGILSACDSFTLTITDENRAPNITSRYPQNLTVNAIASNTLSFNISKHDPDGTIPDTYWYVDGVFTELDEGSSVDEFGYSFGCTNPGSHTIAVEITDGLLNQSLTWTISLVTCPTSSPSAGGGGGFTTVEPKNFSIDRKEVHATLEQGTRKVETITITNHEETNLSFKVTTPDFGRFITLNPEEFILGPGEEKIIVIEINAWDNTPPDLYLGKIEVNGQGTRKKVLISMEVESKRPAFDVRARLIKGDPPLTPGEDLAVDITVFNIGSPGTFEVTMVYVIMNERGEQILPETEVVIVTEELNFIKNFKIPKDSPAGRYVLYIRAVYGENVGSTSIWFSAEDEKRKFPWIYLVIILIAIIIQLIFLIIWLKRRKEEKAQQKMPHGFKPTRV